MTHFAPMKESEGTFEKGVFPSEKACPSCGEKKCTYQVWESSCGGYEDYKYSCRCGYEWWVDGIDS
jgi:DNA-directed RNA polymerase subunit M/transcription elongation factor TFIIS